MQFSYESTNSTGGIETKAVNVPLLTMVPISFLKIDSVSMDLPLRLSGCRISTIMSPSSLSSTLTSASEKWFTTGAFQAQFVNQGSMASGETTLTMSVETSTYDTPSGLAKLLSVLDEAIVKGTIV